VNHPATQCGSRQNAGRNGADKAGTRVELRKKDVPLVAHTRENTRACRQMQAHVYTHPCSSPSPPRCSGGGRVAPLWLPPCQPPRPSRPSKWAVARPKCRERSRRHLPNGRLIRRVAPPHLPCHGTLAPSQPASPLTGESDARKTARRHRAVASLARHHTCRTGSASPGHGARM